MFKKFAAIAIGAIALLSAACAEARGPYGYGYRPYYYHPYGGCGPACATAIGIGGLGVGMALGAILSQPQYVPQPIYVQPPQPIVIERDCYMQPSFDYYGRFMGNVRVCR